MSTFVWVVTYSFILPFVVMLQKNSKPSFLRFIKRGAAILFVLEAASFGVSYGVWHRMNTNRGELATNKENGPLMRHVLGQSRAAKSLTKNNNNTWYVKGLLNFVYYDKWLICNRIWVFILNHVWGANIAMPLSRESSRFIRVN